jgi:hypothetical protein
MKKTLKILVIPIIAITMIMASVVANPANAKSDSDVTTKTFCTKNAGGEKYSNEGEGEEKYQCKVGSHWAYGKDANSFKQNIVRQYCITKSGTYKMTSSGSQVTYTCKIGNDTFSQGGASGLQNLLKSIKDVPKGGCKSGEKWDSGSKKCKEETTGGTSGSETPVDDGSRKRACESNGGIWNGTEDKCELDEGADGCGTKTFFNWGCNRKGIVGALMTIFNWLSIGVTIAVLIGIVYGAIIYTTSGGSPERAKQGIGIIRTAILALLMFFMMWATLNWLVPGGLFN